MSIIEDQLKELMYNQMMRTRNEVAEFCANVCDSNRGYLSLGSIIRQQFSLEPKFESANIVNRDLTLEVNNEVTKQKQKTKLSIVKGEGKGSTTIERPTLTLIK